jgi:hypothetical protein
VTPGAPVHATRSALGELERRAQRERALIALFTLGRHRGFGLRAARVYAFGVFVSYAVALSLTRGSDRRALIQGFVHAALSALSWVGALAALSAAQSLAQASDRDGLAALAAQRGFSERAVLRARALAVAVRITRLVAIPALLSVGVAVARGQSLTWALVTAPALVVYAALLGLTLGVLALLSAELAPRHARALVAALILVPLLLSRAYPGLPSPPDAFASLLDRLLHAGATLA